MCEMMLSTVRPVSDQGLGFGDLLIKPMIYTRTPHQEEADKHIAHLMHLHAYHVRT